MSSSSNSTNPTQPQQRSDQPGLVSGHAEYIKGAAEVGSFSLHITPLIFLSLFELTTNS